MVTKIVPELTVTPDSEALFTDLLFVTVPRRVGWMLLTTWMLVALEAGEVALAASVNVAVTVYAPGLSGVLGWTPALLAR